ncbi:MAG: hypothetical protein JWM19_4788 [Actinomycetia bacterium]|nr:hypothetical protein [Actinomycetes bacterium]
MNQPSASLRDVFVVVLALATGAMDAVTFLRLGNVFSSVITGNLVLLAVAAGQRHASLALNGGLALAGFSVGVLAGSPMAGASRDGQPAWPRQVTVTLAIELVVLAGFSGGWLATGGHPSDGARLALLGVGSAAMGLQTAAVRRLGQMSSTYLTSTLAGLVQALAVRRMPPDWQRSTGVLVTLILGAVLGAVAAELLAGLVPVAVLAPVAVVVTCSLRPAARHNQPEGG